MKKKRGNKLKKKLNKWKKWPQTQCSVSQGRYQEDLKLFRWLGDFAGIRRQVFKYKTDRMRMQSIDTTLQKGEKQFPLFFWQDKEGGWNPARFCETKTWWHLFSVLIHTVINLRSAIAVQWESEIRNPTCPHQYKCFMLGKMVLTDNYRNLWHSES